MAELSTLISNGEEVDYSDVEASVKDVYKVYHPAMAINNSMGLFIGIGIIIIPIISALYTGIEYSRNRVIKYKITYSSLTKTYAAKILVVAVSILAIITVYLIATITTSHICWNGLNETISSIKLFDFSKVEFLGLWHNIKLILLVWAIMFFYSMLVMIVTALLKSSTYGIIGVIAINFVALPLSFTPHNVIFNLINRFLYVNSASPYTFVLDANAVLPAETALLAFISHVGT